jgi:hypothetical protein
LSKQATKTQRKNKISTIIRKKKFFPVIKGKKKEPTTIKDKTGKI